MPFGGQPGKATLVENRIEMGQQEEMEVDIFPSFSSPIQVDDVEFNEPHSI